MCYATIGPGWRPGPAPEPEVTDHLETRPLATVRPIEVRVYEYGLLRTTGWCSTPREAQQVAEAWCRERGVHCEIIGRYARVGAGTTR